jgi:hypothetical protein
MYAALAAVQSDGVSIGEVLGSIPHDVPALVIYAMLLGFVGFVWMGSRKKSS